MNQAASQAAQNFANLVVVVFAAVLFIAVIMAICRLIGSRSERRQVVEVVSEDLDTPRKRFRQHHVDGG